MIGIKGTHWKNHDYSISQRRIKAYHRWKAMMARCYKNTHPKYRLYGARGIKVCDEWHQFTCYYVDVGDPPHPRLQLDRTNNDGDYEPGNWRWATHSQQQINRRPYTHGPRGKRHSNAGIQVQDETGAFLSTRTAADVLGCQPTTLRRRLRHMSKKNREIKIVSISDLARRKRHAP